MERVHFAVAYPWCFRGAASRPQVSLFINCLNYDTICLHFGVSNNLLLPPDCVTLHYVSCVLTASVRATR